MASAIIFNDVTNVGRETSPFAPFCFASKTRAKILRDISAYSNFTNAHLGFTMRNNKSLLLNQSGIFRRRQIWFPTPGQSFGDGFPLVAVTSFLYTQTAEPNARMTATWAEFHIPNPQAHYQITHAFRFQPSCVLSTWNSLTHAGNTGPVKLWISIPVATGTTQQLSKLIE